MVRRAKIWLVASLLMIVALLVLFPFLLSGRARGAYKTVMTRWEETIGAPEEVFARFPPQSTNAPARELIESALPLGIDLAPRDDEGMPRPVRAQTKRFRGLMAASSSWLNGQLGKDGGTVDAPPDAVEEFLAEFREPLDRIHALLESGNAPEWTTDMRRLHSAPIPNLRGHLDLNKMLIIDGLAALHAGDADHARRALESAWTLQDHVGREPIMIVQIVRMSMIRQQAAAVRLMPWLEHWIERLDPATYRAPYQEALLLEGWAWPQFDFSASNKDDVFTKIQYAITGPYMKLGSVDASERWRQTILELQQTEAWCEPALRRSGVRLTIPMPWWNRIGDMLSTDVEGTAIRFAQVQLQLELTRRLLELEAARRDGDRWPELDADALVADACPDDRWIYDVDGDVASLSLERGPEIENDPRFPSSWSFSLDASEFSW